MWARNRPPRRRAQTADTYACDLPQNFIQFVRRVHAPLSPACLNTAIDEITLSHFPQRTTDPGRFTKAVKSNKHQPHLGDRPLNSVGTRQQPFTKAGVKKDIHYSALLPEAVSRFSWFERLYLHRSGRSTNGPFHRIDPHWDLRLPRNFPSTARAALASESNL